jgi:hypothetical protein
MPGPTPGCALRSTGQEVLRMARGKAAVDWVGDWAREAVVRAAVVRARDAREIRKEEAARFIRSSRGWNTDETCVLLQDTPVGVDAASDVA